MRLDRLARGADIQKAQKELNLVLSGGRERGTVHMEPIGYSRDSLQTLEKDAAAFHFCEMTHAAAVSLDMKTP